MKVLDKNTAKTLSILSHSLCLATVPKPTTHMDFCRFGFVWTNCGLDLTAEESALHVVVCWWWERGEGRSETDNYKYKATKARMQEARITGSSKQLGLVRTCFCPAEVRTRGNYLHAVGHPSDSDSDLSTPSTHLSIFLNRLLSFSVVFPFCLSLLLISTEFSLSLVQVH